MADFVGRAQSTAHTKKTRSRLTRVLQALGIAASSWYHQPIPKERHQRRGPKALPVPPAIASAVVAMATQNPWYGYKRIAVMCRRAGHKVTNRQCYRVMKTHGLLQKRKARAAEIYQTLKLYELLPDGPNDLWQTDVTFIHIPGFGWWYAVTVSRCSSMTAHICRLTYGRTASTWSSGTGLTGSVSRTSQRPFLSPATVAST